MPGLKTALVGVGGVGAAHLETIRHFEETGEMQLVAVCDKYLERYPDRLADFHAHGVRCYDDFDRFIAAGETLDLIVIATPIPLHKPMCIKALQAGYNILLEKPPAVTIQDLDEMIAAHREHPQLCAVNFQHTVEPSFLRLLDQVRSGRLGKIRAIRARGIWSRSNRYYQRTPWAGKLFMNRDYVLDGTVNNPLAHLLNNSLFVPEALEKGSGAPVSVQGELYHANAIEGEDTSCLRVKTAGGTEILFTATLCAPESEVETPGIRVEGSDEDASWDYDGNVAFYAKGSTAPSESCRIAPLEWSKMYAPYRNVMNSLLGKDRVGCSLEQTRHFVLTSNLAFESSRIIHAVPADFTHIEQHDGATTVCINDIAQTVRRSQSEGRMLSEYGVAWGVRTQPAAAEGYRKFEMFR